MSEKSMKVSSFVSEGLLALLSTFEQIVCYNCNLTEKRIQVYTFHTYSPARAPETFSSLSDIFHSTSHFRSTSGQFPEFFGYFEKIVTMKKLIFNICIYFI